MVDEAIKYTAITLMDLSQDQQNAIDESESFYRRVGRRDHEIDVYKKLAELLRADPDRESEALRQ